MSNSAGPSSSPGSRASSDSSSARTLAHDDNENATSNESSKKHDVEKGQKQMTSKLESEKKGKKEQDNAEDPFLVTIKGYAARRLAGQSHLADRRFFQTRAHQPAELGTSLSMDVDHRGRSYSNELYTRLVWSIPTRSSDCGALPDRRSRGHTHYRHLRGWILLRTASLGTSQREVWEKTNLCLFDNSLRRILCWMRSLSQHWRVACLSFSGWLLCRGALDQCTDCRESSYLTEECRRWAVSSQISGKQK